MTNQIPRSPDGLWCSRWHKPMAKVCHTCNLWTHLALTDHNTGNRVDEWRCAEAWTPLLLIEIASKAHSGAAATESFRNEMARRADEASAQQRLAPRLNMKLLESSE